MRVFAAFGFFTVFVGTLAALWFTEVIPEPGFDARDAATADPLDTPAPTVPVSASEFPVYQYSVVPGGVRSAEEVGRVVSRDPVVAAHYSEIDVASLRRERLQTATVAHVSYRMDDKVYFTSKPVRIDAGEAVLTDGQKTIRERCGNIISVEPIGPASPNEPPAEQLDRVIAPVGPAAQRAASAAPTGGPIPSFNPPSGSPTGTPFSITPPGTTPPGGGTPPGGVPPTTWTPGFPLPPGAPTPVVPPGGDPPGPTPTPLMPTPTPTPPPDVPPGPTPTPPPDVPPGPTPTPPPDFPPAPPPDPPYDPPLDPPLPVPEPSTFVLVGIGAAAGLVKLLKNRRASK